MREGVSQRSVFSGSRTFWRDTSPTTLLNFQQVCRLAALSLLLLLVLGGTSAWAQLPAFPGAEGFGAGAVGGRNGDVYIVDSLADTNTLGTLRHAVNTAPGASRTIVFNTSGTITLNTNLEITQSNITIAGQTAPGLGITLKGKTLRVLGSNNIVRHVHVRVGQAGADIDSAAVEGGVNNILDHVSGSWSGDEVISVADTASLATVQWSFMHEALNYENHAYGSLIRPDNDSKVSYHHNFYAHNRSRNARIGTYNGSLLEFEFRNNVIFDWIDEVTYSGGSNEFVDVNFIGNYGVAGPSTGSKVNRLFSGGSTNTEIYQEGNYSDGNQDPNRDGVLAPFTSPYFVNDFTPKADAPFSFSGLTYPVTTSSAPDAYDDILDHGGAFFWNRDANDLRVIDQLETMQGGIILTEADVGGFVSIPVVTRPAGWDSDGDGMPGDWELDHGLDPDSAADRTGDFDLDGYNNLEEYLNDVGAFPGPQPIVFDGSTDDKYAKISNWDINWQPSRYDEVRIHNSTVIVDAVGQHAGTLQLGPDPNDSATLRVTNGWLKVADDVEVGSGSGTGTLSVSTGAFAEATNVNVNTLGTLTGGGEIVGDVINSGIVSPGVFIGEMTVDGSFEQEPNTTAQG